MSVATRRLRMPTIREMTPSDAAMPWEAARKHFYAHGLERASVDAIARQVESEGVAQVVVLSDDIGKYDTIKSRFPAGTQFHISEFAFSQAVWDEVVQCVKDVYAPYNVQVVTEDPTPALQRSISPSLITATRSAESSGK